MTNNSKVMAYNIAEDTVSSNEEHWYNKSLPFWLITFTISAGIIAVCILFIVPLIFGDGTVTNMNGEIIPPEELSRFEKIYYGFLSLAPYIVGICGGISWLRYNIMHFNGVHSVGQYVLSILMAIVGVVVGGLLVVGTIVGVTIFAVLLLAIIGWKSAKHAF